MQYVIENPTSPYAVEFIRCMRRRFNARAVCFYTAKEHQPGSKQPYPELFSKEYVAANYLVDPRSLDRFIQHLRDHHRIEAVIPYKELTLNHAITIAEGLKLDWVQPEIMRRFRNKFDLKTHLRATDPDLRINHVQLVHSPNEAMNVVREHRLSRFVLKPNDGFANIGIGCFSADDPISMIVDYWERNQIGTVLLEEFIEGREYHCNGQVDAEGRIMIVDIGRTFYTETEQREIVCLRTEQTPSHDPEFQQIADYTRRLIKASGLRRSPFHAELRVDKIGPSLLECAARIIGADWAPFSRQMHGQSFDMFDLAAHYYGSSAPYGTIGLNWENYDSSILCKIRGVSKNEEQIHQLEGVTEIESLPQFLAWTQKPTIGQRLTSTSSLVSSPYAVMLRCQTSKESEELDPKVRELLKWNSRRHSVIEKFTFKWSRLVSFIRWKIDRYRRNQINFFDLIFPDPS